MFTVGYGDIAPRDTLERICSIFAIIVGCFFYSFIIGNVTAQIQYVESHEAQYRTKMKGIQSFLEARKVVLRTTLATVTLPQSPSLQTLFSDAYHRIH